MAKKSFAPGDRIRAWFGDREVTGRVAYVSGHRIHVVLDIEGTDDPVTSLYREDQLSPA